jgi:hypothetical protein
VDRNLYEKTLYGVGYIGEGIYKVSLQRVYSPHYIYWTTMLKRCYSEKFHKTNPSYIGCTVAEEWHSFQNFAEWYDENYYEVEGEVMCLDKDILVKGNKSYSSETCIFVPSTINKLFVKSKASRGDFPIGVSLRKDTLINPYRVICSTGKRKQKCVGHFNTPEEGFLAYKVFKENVIKEFANNYKNQIPVKLYNAMMKYKVEITD